MSPSDPKDKPSFNIGLLLLDGFNAMAMQAFVDPFRCANYLRGSKLYDWSYLSVDGDDVVASNGLTMGNLTNAVTSTGNFDLLVINSSWGVERFDKAPWLSWLREQAQRGTTLLGIDTGAFVLAYAGLLLRKRAAVHYEHIAAFRELFPDIAMGEDLFVIDGDRLTCAGGLAATDMALEIIRLQQGIELTNAASRYIFHERLRPGDEGQFPDRREPVGYAAPAKLREAIILMERNLEQPLSIGDIARKNALSQRQLERLFQQHSGITPVRYYLDVRLDRARGLVTQTELPIVDIAVACGFSGSAQFSKAYRRRFANTPSRDRIEGRVPFQFRSFPSHAGV